MGFLQPSALALSALALPIIIFYMLKLRRQPRRVSSLLLWEQVLADRQANAPWQRLKRNLLLLLQLLILALLVMALARPYLTVEARVQGNTILLLDASASMQATDLSPNRFAAAKDAALDLIARLDSDNSVTLIAVADTPQVLAAATTDRNLLRQALTAAQPSNGTADWAAALALAAANAATVPDATIAVIGDGGSGEDNLNLTDLSRPLTFIPIGSQADNQGIVAMSLRDGVDGPELFVRLFNAADQPVERLVDIDVDEQIFDARRLDIPAQGEASFTVTGLPLEARHIQANLVNDDALPLDDTAWVVRRGRPTEILIVGPGNLFLERALALLPDINLQRASPDQPLPQTRFDMLIFDRHAPNILPEGNVLFIAPPNSTPLFSVQGVFSQTRLTQVDSSHPLLSYVELEQLHVSQSQQLDPLPWMRPLVQTARGPLILAGQADGRRVAILAFDLFKSDWPLQIEFPIFMLNVTRWLVPGEILEQAQTLRPGQNFDLPIAAAQTIFVTTPTNNRVELPPDPATSLSFNQTDTLGIYQLTTQDETGQNQRLTEFAVNLLAVEETNIAPRSQLAAPNPNSANPTPADSTMTEGRWVWWGPLAALALLVLLVEWWVYWRGEGGSKS